MCLFKVRCHRWHKTHTCVQHCCNNGWKWRWMVWRVSHVSLNDITCIGDFLPSARVSFSDSGIARGQCAVSEGGHYRFSRRMIVRGLWSSTLQWSCINYLDCVSDTQALSPISTGTSSNTTTAAFINRDVRLHSHHLHTLAWGLILWRSKHFSEGDPGWKGHIPFQCPFGMILSVLQD